jgi:hypothetical protein
MSKGTIAKLREFGKQEAGWDFEANRQFVG